MQFRVIVVTDPQTHTHKQTHRQDRLQYTAPQLACSVINYTCVFWIYCNANGVYSVISLRQ